MNILLEGVNPQLLVDVLASKLKKLLTHSLIHSLVRLLTHSPIHSLILIPLL